MEREPIFILWARSFWLGILPLLAVLLDLGAVLVFDPVAGPPAALALATVVNLAGSIFGAEQLLDPAAVESVMVKLAPLFGLIVAQQRAGAARPYSLNPGDIS